MGKIYRHPLVQTPLRVDGQLAASNPVIRCAQSCAVCLIYSDAIFESSPNSVSLVTGVESASGIGTIDPTGNALAGVDGSESISDSGTVVSSGDALVAVAGLESQSLAGDIAGVSCVIENADAILDGEALASDLGSVVAVGFVNPSETLGEFFGRQRKQYERNDAVARVSGVFAESDQGWINLGIGMWHGLEYIPTSSDATATLIGCTAFVGSGKHAVSAQSSIQVRGSSVNARVGTLRAKGVLNPSDEELILLAMEAISV